MKGRLSTQSTAARHLLIMALLATPVQANDMVNLMRGMFTGLALLGQASNASGLSGGYPGLWGAPLGTNPWASPWAPSPATPWGMSSMGYPLGSMPMQGAPTGGVPWAGIPWANAQMPGYADWFNRQQQNRSGPYSHLMRLLQGSWETHSGGLLLIKGNLARLYVSRDRYQDLEITADQHYVWMRPAGQVQAPDRYEHRIFDRRVILRDRNGKMLILRRHQAQN